MIRRHALALSTLLSIAGTAASAEARQLDKALFERVFEASPARIGTKLPKGSAAVAFRLADRVEAGERRVFQEQRWLEAFVVYPGGGTVRLDLGVFDPIEDLIEGWREAVGVGADRSIAANSPASRTSTALEHKIGETLRLRLVRPLLPSVGMLTQAFVSVDGPLNGLPLDALPYEDGSLGDQCVVTLEPSFARFAQREARASGSDARMLQIAGDAARHAEVATLAARFEGRFGRPTQYLVDANATVEAFRAYASSSLYVHVVALGAFDDGAEALALAGRTPDPASSAPFELVSLRLSDGQIDGKQLAALDLSAADLVVLSVPQSAAGLVRMGQPVASLQNAALEAGARSVVACLWEVDAEPARELMTEFYRQLWVEERSKAQALWGAKRMLRTRGRPSRDWAGWVLAGAAD